MWTFYETDNYLKIREKLKALDMIQREDILLRNRYQLYAWYGKYMSICIACKHVGWYLKKMKDSIAFCKTFNVFEKVSEQIIFIEHYFDSMAREVVA